MENMKNDNTFTLPELTSAIKYRYNIDDLTNGIYELYDNLRYDINSDTNLKYILENLYNHIQKNSANIEPYLKKQENFLSLYDKTNFKSILSKFSISEKALNLLDFISFKIVDFSVAFGNAGNPKDKEKRQFSNWPYRTSQLLFKQKGQLWLLNCLFNINSTVVEKGLNNEEQVRQEIRNIIDKDFSPYLNIVNDDYIDKKIKSMKNNKYDQNVPLFIPKVKDNERLMGFELEHQVRFENSEIIYQKEGEKGLLKEITKQFKESLFESLQKVSNNPDEVIKFGTLTRDVSNARLKNYIACEYSSPADNIENLKKNASELCELISEIGGVVREDCGTHVHVSIEDLKHQDGDTDSIRMQKLEALKRIFKNFILLTPYFESILPEHRKADNFLLSGQAYPTFFKDDINLVIELIDNCKDYLELQGVLNNVSKSLPLDLRENTIEFRAFPGTTNYEILATWFEFLNQFVGNSIRGEKLEDCLNQDLLKQLQDLTSNGKKIYGMLEDDTQNIAFNCNSINYDEFRMTNSPVIKTGTMSKDELYRNFIDEIQAINVCLFQLEGNIIPNLGSASSALSIYRKPGEVLTEQPAILYRCPSNKDLTKKGKEL